MLPAQHGTGGAPMGTRSDDGTDVWVVPMNSSEPAYPLLQTPFEEYDARFSPDGKWMSFVSDESGRRELHVTSFPVTGPKAQVSTNGARSNVRWTRGGREIIYTDPDGTLMSVPVTVKNSAIETAEAVPLFKMPPETKIDVTPDGERFLMTKRVGARVPISLTLVKGWR